MSGAGPAGRLATALGRAYYRALLVAYPKSFRIELGADAAELFAEACAESWRETGWRGVLSRFARAIVDVPQSGFAERRGPPPSPKPPRSSGAFWANLAIDLRDTWRALRRRPGLTFAITTTLALAIGANTAVFSVVDATLLRPLPFAQADRVVYLELRDAANKRAGEPTVANVRIWRSLVGGLDRLEAESTRGVLLTDRDGGTRVRAMYGSRGVFEMLGARPILGRLLHETDADTGGVLVAESLWRARYGADTGIIGRTVEIDGEAATIVGVVPNLPSDTPGIRNLLYRTVPSEPAAAAQFRATVVGWLKAGVTIEALNAELQSATLMTDAKGTASFAQAKFPSNIFWGAAEQRNTQLALFTGVCLLLMLAAINVASLLLAATRARRGELALRAALGAGRARIVRLLLLESLVLGAAGCAGGLLVARYAVAGFTQLTPGPQLASRLEAIRLDAVVVGYAVAIAFVTSLAIGHAAAWRHAVGASAGSLREADTRVAGRRGLRGGFVLVESALTVMLLIVAGLVGRAFLTMRFSDPGFAADRVVQVSLALPETTYASLDRRDRFFDALQQSVSRLPGVVEVGLGYEAIPPADFLMVGRIVADSGVTNDGTGPPQSFVDSRYFPLMGIPIIEGRGFDPAEIGRPATGDEIPTLVSRAMAVYFWPRGSAIGGGFTVTSGNTVRSYRVRGVTGNVSGWDVIMPGCDRCRWQVYLPLPASRRYTELLARVADGAPIPEGAIRRAILDIDRQIPIDDGFITAADRRQEFGGRTTFRAVLLGGFATIALALAALGIAAVASRTVTERLKEMSIRLALGARPQQVRRLVLRQAMLPVLMGMTIGTLAAIAVTPALGSILQDVDPFDPLTIASALGLLIGVTLLATWAPARRATQVDPVTALRSE